jgi:type I restriction enzyme S subunit
VLSSVAVIEKLQQLAEQSVSTYPSIKPSDIGACEIVVPPIEDGKKIQALLTPLFQTIAANQEESTNLATLRDTMLPRVMNGEIQI